MSMIGEYVRVTPAELDRAIKDPEWALGFVEEIQDREEETDLSPGQARHLSTYKAWNVIAFLLERAKFPVNIVYGEVSFAEDEDWGYGPPRYLPADRVRLAARALAGISYDDLIRGVAPADLTAADIYPTMGDEPAALEWGRSWYEPLIPYFAAAARDGDAMLVWLD